MQFVLKVVGSLFYCAGVLLGSLGFVAQLVISKPSQYFGRLRLAKQLLVLSSRTRLNPKLTVFCVLPALWPFARYTDAEPSQFATAAFVLAMTGMLVNIRIQRILSVSNMGSGRWDLHLNIVKSKKKSEDEAQNELWRGAKAELSEIAALAAAARVRTLKLASPLLVNEDTAGLFVAKLNRALRQNGLVPVIEFGISKPMGAFKSGAFRLLRRYQTGLKANRFVSASDTVLMTREIVIRLT